MLTFRRFIGVLVTAALTGLLATPPLVGSAEAGGAGRYRANVVRIPPRVQLAGGTYRLSVRIQNLGPKIWPLCVDFTDDNSSWLIEAPGLRSYDSDAFCAGTLRAGQTRTLTFLVIAAKTGAHRMSLTIGKAKIYSNLNDIVIDDSGALGWESNFVIT